jgi:glucokinase
MVRCLSKDGPSTRDNLSASSYSSGGQPSLAIDIGASGMRCAPVSAKGLLTPPTSVDIARDASTEELTRTLQGLIRQALSSKTDCRAVGIAFPSFLDPNGKVAWCVNLPGLDGVDLRDAAATVTDLPIRPIPDVAAAALGEALVGAEGRVRRFLCVGIGSGINAGMVVGGELVTTAVGCLGDAGHVCVEPDGPACFCGGRGCVEALCSGLALARDGQAIGAASAAEVIDLARNGIAEAAAIVERAGRALGRAIAIWSALLWPDHVAVAGGVSDADQLLLDPARRELARVGPPHIVGRLTLSRAVLGRDASIVGAGLFARNRPPRGR